MRVQDLGVGVRLLGLGVGGARHLLHLLTLTPGLLLLPTAIFLFHDSGPEVGVYPAVEEGVNARTTDGDPQTDKERQAVILESLGVRVKVRQDVVEIQRHPADGEHYHHRDQELDALTFGANLPHALVLRHLP